MKGFKIEFWLKKPDTNQENLEYITISASKKPDQTAMPNLANFYACEVYLSTIKAKIFPIYGINPIDTFRLAIELTKTYLQGLIERGYTISGAENKEPWKLEKLSDNYLQERINGIKNNKEISSKDKQKIFQILKESFGKTVIADQLNKAIDEK